MFLVTSCGHVSAQQVFFPCCGDDDPRLLHELFLLTQVPNQVRHGIQLLEKQVDSHLIEDMHEAPALQRVADMEGVLGVGGLPDEFVKQHEATGTSTSEEMSRGQVRPSGDCDEVVPCDARVG
ncbi:hypothetical protein D3C72_1978040 [compost metagenome]